MALREQKRARTRDALYDAAIALFTERGYQATTMDDIAEQALVSRATAFKYFPRKEDLLLEWAARRREGVAATAAAMGSERGDPERIGKLVVGLAASYPRDPAGRPLVEAWLISSGPLKPEAWASGELLAGLVRDGQAAGTIRADVDAGVVGRLLLNAFLGPLYQWAAQDRSGAWLRREVAAAVGVIVDGVRPQRST